jgi:hypothetical protein
MKSKKWRRADRVGIFPILVRRPKEQNSRARSRLALQLQFFAMLHLVCTLPT